MAEDYSDVSSKTIGTLVKKGYTFGRALHLLVLTALVFRCTGRPWIQNIQSKFTRREGDTSMS